MKRRKRKPDDAPLAGDLMSVEVTIDPTDDSEQPWAVAFWINGEMKGREVVESATQAVNIAHDFMAQAHTICGGLGVDVEWVERQGPECPL